MVYLFGQKFKIHEIDKLLFTDEKNKPRSFLQADIHEKKEKFANSFNLEQDLRVLLNIQDERLSNSGDLDISQFDKEVEKILITHRSDSPEVITMLASLFTDEKFKQASQTQQVQLFFHVSSELTEIYKLKKIALAHFNKKHRPLLRKFGGKKRIKFWNKRLEWLSLYCELMSNGCYVDFPPRDLIDVELTVKNCDSCYGICYSKGEKWADKYKDIKNHMIHGRCPLWAPEFQVCSTCQYSIRWECNNSDIFDTYRTCHVSTSIKGQPLMDAYENGVSLRGKDLKFELTEAQSWCDKWEVARHLIKRNWRFTHKNRESFEREIKTKCSVTIDC